MSLEDEHREVYLHFGAVVARVSAFETVLQNILLMVAKRSGKAATDAELDELEEKLQNSKTLGQLIGDVVTEVPIEDQVKKLMADALKRRNFLMHRFFRVRAFAFETAAGRKRMVEELKEAHAYIFVATNFAEQLGMDIGKHFGITPEAVAEEAERMRRREREADGEDRKNNVHATQSHEREAVKHRRC
jgi:hypothetical protein